MNTVVFRLPADVTIRTVSDLKSELGGLLHQIGHVNLDAQDISRIDAIGLQLILIFRRHLAAEKRNVHISNASASLLKVATTLGLATAIADDATDESA
ncbi:MAG: lipid asymmetry maintenance protein MlaB [bacterium]